MSSRLILRIQDKYARLTTSEQRLADILVASDDNILTYSATELAQLAGISKATVARFFQKLGYADFNEVRTQAREERNRTQPYQVMVADTLVARNKPQQSVSISEHLEMEVANITRTFETLNTELLRDSAKLIKQAPCVWFLGLGIEAGLAQYGRVLLSRVRPNVQVLGATQGAWAEDLAMTGPKDVLIILNLGVGHRVVKSILSFAKTTRMKVIVIADHFSIKYLKRYADLIIPCYVASPALGSSHIAIVSTLRLITLAYVDIAKNTAEQRSQIIGDINEELDDFYYSYSASSNVSKNQ